VALRTQVMEALSLSTVTLCLASLEHQ
jgi:hypothetical protein